LNLRGRSGSLQPECPLIMIEVAGFRQHVTRPAKCLTVRNRYQPILLFDERFKRTLLALRDIDIEQIEYCSDM
jgi:hypothetical protein